MIGRRLPRKPIRAIDVNPLVRTDEVSFSCVKINRLAAAQCGQACLTGITLTPQQARLSLAACLVGSRCRKAGGFPHLCGGKAATGWLLSLTLVFKR
jgi:hypothetical protein